MALIKCPECGNMISQFALRCPQCGIPMDKIIELQKYNNVGEIAIPHSDCFFKYMVDGHKVISLFPEFTALALTEGYESAIKTGDAINPSFEGGAYSDYVSNNRYILSISIWDNSEMHIDISRMPCSHTSELPIVFDPIKDRNSLALIYNYAKDCVDRNEMIPKRIADSSLTLLSKKHIDDDSLVSMNSSFELMKIKGFFQFAIKETSIRKELNEGKTYYDENGMKTWDVWEEEIPEVTIYPLCYNIRRFLELFVQIYDVIYDK